MPDESNKRPPPPSPRDWALLAISLVFVVMGLVLLPIDRDVAVRTLAFFGLCAAVIASIVVRKQRAHRLQPLQVGMVGSVPLRPSRLRAVLLGGSVLGLGAILLAFGAGMPTLLHGVSWLLVGVGAAVLLGVALGRIPAGGLCFDPRGITITERSLSYLVPWDAIAEARAGEIHDNGALFLWTTTPGLLLPTPPATDAQVAKRLATCRAWLGADIVIMTSAYGLDANLLALAVERYVRDPQARSELGLALPSASHAT